VIEPGKYLLSIIFSERAQGDFYRLGLLHFHLEYPRCPHGLASLSLFLCLDYQAVRSFSNNCP
jgi:hypothetical protein